MAERFITSKSEERRIVMALYNDTVMNNFMNPQNVGEIENPSGTGIYGSPVCGDMMQMQIKVDENDVITDCKFKTFGCGSAIASSSMATQMIIGKTVEEALKITNKDVVDELGGLPAVKIKSAIYEYAQKNNKTYAGLEEFDPNADEDEHDHEIEEE